MGGGGGEENQKNQTCGADTHGGRKSKHQVSMDTATMETERERERLDFNLHSAA